MSSIITNRTFLIETPNEIIQKPIKKEEIIIEEKKEEFIEKKIKKKSKYFLPEFYI